MTNLKKVTSHKIETGHKNQLGQDNMKRMKKSSIHKCPVHTLLTSIFSGIAWNG